MADFLGDPTARLQGRLTLNPIKHIDPIGSIIVPIITSIAGFTFGWAKPVPFNPYNLRDMKKGELFIAAAGPFSNLAIALVFGLIMRYLIISDNVIVPFMVIASQIVIVNIVLAVFNLIPMPPLDGSKIFFSMMPNKYVHIRNMMENNGPVFALIAVFILWPILSPVIPWVFQLFTGISL